MTLACAHCGTEGPAARRTCQACGASLELRCAHCGFENRLGDLFCGGCGVELARLHEPAAQPAGMSLEEAKRDELRTVTVLMADLDGYPAMIEQLGRERAAELMAIVHERLARQHVVDAFEGYIDKLLDGDIMALFGAPLAHEDAPERAVRAAVRMHGELAALQADGTLPAAAPLRLRIGLNTGLVRVGGVGAGGQMEYTAMGDSVNLAARLMTACPWGGTLISEATHRRVARSFELEPLEPIKVKGKREPQRVWRVLAEGRRAARIEIAASEGMARMIGREELLGELESAWRQAAAGHGRVVGIVGEAGIGKSRLVYELQQRIADQATFFEGRCLSYGEHLGFTPIRDVLSAICGLRDTDSAAERRARIEATVAELGCDPSCAAPLGFLLGLDFGDPEFAKLEPQQVRDRMRDAFCEALGGLCRRQPLVLFFDDLQWCDVDSLELLDHMVRGCPDRPVLLIVAYRGDFAHDWDRLPHYVGLQPRRLTLDETRQLVGSLLARRGLLADETRVDASLAEACYDKSQGNPFFIDQTVTALLTRAEQTGRPTVDLRRGRLLLPPAELDALVPDSVEEILLSRIDKLPASPRTVLQAASVALIGRWFRLSALRRVVEADDLEADLELLKRRELIFEEPTSDDDRQYVFEHALARDVAYNALLRAERRRLHGLVGAYIEEHYANSLEAYIDDLSHHFYHAEQAERAVVYLPQSAERAARRYSNAQAKLHYQRAVEMLDRLLAGGGNGQVTARKLDVLKGLAHVQALTGDPGQAETGLQRLELARTAADAQAAIDAAYGLARYYTDCGRLKEARAAWREVLAGYLAAEEWEGARDAEFGLGQLYQMQGRYEEALEHFQAATAIQVERLPFDAFGTWMQYTNLSAAYHELGRLDEALEAVDRSDEALAALPPGDPFRTRLRSYSAGNRGNALAARGRLREALANFELTLADATATGERIVEAEVRYRMGAVLLLLAELRPAREHLEEALAVAQEAELARWEAAAHLGLAELNRLQGEAEAAQQQVEAAAKLVEGAEELAGAGEVEQVAARLAADREDWDRAWDLLEAAWRVADSQHRALLIGSLLPERASVALRRGDRALAETLATEAVAVSERLGLTLERAAAGRVRAELQAAADLPSALAELAKGLELARAAEAVELEVALLGQRARLLAERDPAAAQADLEAAQARLRAVRPIAGPAFEAAVAARCLLGATARLAAT